MIAQIAWRNIWRSPVRSSVLLLSIVLGIWAGLFIISFSFGLNTERVAETINTTVSHIQIHNPEFLEEQNPAASIVDTAKLIHTLKTHPEVKAYSPRLVINGMAATTATVRGVRMLAVNPELEPMVNTIPKKIIEGKWLSAEVKNPIVVGQKLAEIFGLKIGSKLVFTFQDEENNLVSASFKVAGIYKSFNAKLDEVMVYAVRSDVAGLLQGASVHQVAVMTSEPKQAIPLSADLQSQFPQLTIKNWKEISPELAYLDELMAFALTLVMLIIMLALMFGIINNMLMAVLERKHELGMLQAVGMNKMRIFIMIVLETLYLGLLGGPLGMLLGYITIKLTGSYGINLSMFGKGLENFGIATRVFPNLDSLFYVFVGGMVVSIALLASIFPARKALKLNPIEAIRGI